jgi:hypothetical protein
MLSQNVKQRIRGAVALGAEIVGPKLVPTNAHPVRNPHAHLWREIKTRMGKSYSECEDSDEKEIMEVIKFYVENPR